jgi:hypothetical protein
VGLNSTPGSPLMVQITGSPTGTTDTYDLLITCTDRSRLSPTKRSQTSTTPVERLSRSRPAA